MKRKLIILSIILWPSIIPLQVTACSIDANINHDDYLPNTDTIVNLKDCAALFNASDLTYSFLTVTKEQVTQDILTILKYNIREVRQNDYSITFNSKNGQQATNINIVGNYNIILIASETSKNLKGILTLNLSVVDDRTDISQINYDENNWYLSSRNTVKDLFTKFEIAIFKAVENINYQLGAFLDIKIQHKDTTYTNKDQNSTQVLDVEDSYTISATSESNNSLNYYIVGSIDKLTVTISDERQSVSNLNSSIFNDYHPNNFDDSGKTLHHDIRNIINNIFTLDGLTESDFDLIITDENNNILNNDESKLTTLKYQVTIDATNSKFLKDINSNLILNIVDQVTHLDNLEIDTSSINLDVATKASTLKDSILHQIDVAAKFSGAEKYLIVKLTQNDSEIKDDAYLDPDTVEINVTPNLTSEKQYFGGQLNTTLSVIDNRIDLKDEEIASSINKSILSIGYSVLNTLEDVKSSVLSTIKEVTQDSHPNISQNIDLNDLDINLAGYSSNEELLKEDSNVSLTINANNNSRYIKNNLQPIKININFSRIKGSIKTTDKTPIEFVDYDSNNKPHLMTQTDTQTIVVYDTDLSTTKYSIDYSPETNIILDYKVSKDGTHDYWVMQTKIDDTQYQIDYYIDNKIVSTDTFDAYAIIASINKYSETLYIRLDTTEEHTRVGDLYKMKASQKTTKVDLSQVSPTPFAIDMIRSSETSNQIYIQSENKIYLINEDATDPKSKIEEHDITNDYFFDYDDNNNIYELKENGLYRNKALIKSITPNPNLLYDSYNYKFISNFTVDQNNNFYYLYRDITNKRYTIIKNQEVLFTVTDETSLNAYLKILPNDIWELTVGSKVYTNERGK